MIKLKTKNKLRSLAAVGMVFMFVACNESGNKTETTTNKDTVTTTVSPATVDTGMQMRGIDTTVKPRPLRPGN